MDPGIDKTALVVQAVVETAKRLGVRPEVRSTAGTGTSVVEVYLLDGDVKACALPEFPFRQMRRVADVRRVTPSTVSLAANGHTHTHQIQLGSVTIGNDLPCSLIAGPCTVDRRVDDLVRALIQDHGIKMIRGGCWKPRSNAWSFPGFGKQAVRWLLEAAGNYNAEVVFLEVIDETHLHDVEAIVDEVSYPGKIVLWVGARTENQTLLRKLGLQDRFPVMLKNPINCQNVAQWVRKAEFVLAGQIHFDDYGRLIGEQSLAQGNDQIMLCSRGVEHHDPESPYRFLPWHELMDAIRSKYWPTVGVDVSHSAGTMENDLVLVNLSNALQHNPAFVMLETYLDDGESLCDAEQAVRLARLGEFQAMIAGHNEQIRQ